MTYTAIVATESHRITKFAEFDTEQEAQAHCDKHGGFVYAGPYSPSLHVDGEIVTVQPDVETAEEVIARLEKVLDKHLDAVAKSYGYLDVPHILSYIDDENPVWDAQARAFKLFRSRFWVGAIAIQQDATAGNRPIPTEAELIAELPKFDDFITT